jgi:hypothetical protein
VLGLALGDLAQPDVFTRAAAALRLAHMIDRFRESLRAERPSRLGCLFAVEAD